MQNVMQVVNTQTNYYGGYTQAEGIHKLIGALALWPKHGFYVPDCSQIKIAASINYLLTMISCIYILQSGYLGNIKA